MNLLTTVPDFIRVWFCLTLASLNVQTENYFHVCWRCSFHKRKLNEILKTFTQISIKLYLFLSEFSMLQGNVF